MSRFVVLYNFNKYYNRIIRNLGGFEAYLALITPGENTPAPFRGLLRENVNFFYENGVYAQHVINIDNNEPQFAKVEHPDYLVAEESWTEGEGEQATTTVKVTRWYVLSVERVRGNQFKLSLRRDLLADYYSEVLDAPVFVERGTPQFITDPAIFNSEGFTFNQIKRNEILLSDNKYSGKGKGWIVGYLARGTEGTSISASGKEELPSTYVEYENLPEKIKYMITNGYGHYIDPIARRFMLYVGAKIPDTRYSGDYWAGLFGILIERYNYVAGASKYIYGANMTNALAFSNPYPTIGPGGFPITYTNYWSGENENRTQDLLTQAASESEQDLRTELVNLISHATLANDQFTSASLITTYNNIIYKKDNKYYRLTIRRLYEDDYYMPGTSNKGIHAEYTYAQIIANSDRLSSEINKFLNKAASLSQYVNKASEDQSKIAAGIGTSSVRYSFIVEEITELEAEVTIPSTRNQLYDAPYDMFAIPYGNVAVKDSGSVILTTSGNVALPIARGIALSGTELKVYDIQILPYLPFEEALDNQGNIDITALQEGKDYAFITEDVSGTDVNVSIVLFPRTCRGTFDLNISDATNEFINAENDILEKKVKSETQIVRFVSPNFASIFEINVQKNNGITELNVDYFYKPYSPYIHVAPYFKNMYGLDFNDPKGLICSGEFSVATASDQWSLYEVQNKNYELIFNRQIKNLDVNNWITMREAETTGKIGIATTALGGGAGGAAGGAMVGGGWGAAIGGVVGSVGGGVVSGIGYKKDIQYLTERQQEARSYAKDMYTYQLGNIKALPNTLTKVSTFTENNKIFPFIEFYDCTEEEKQALRDKIKYNGMTIMRIGKISDFININISRYAQAQLIRLVGIDEDSEVVAEIANELKEGAYFYGSDTIES